MKEKYNALFDKLAPIRSDEELLRAVLDRKAVNMSNSNEKKKIGRKAVIIPAVAATVLLCTTVGVSAAANWDLSSAIQTLFQKPETNEKRGIALKDFAINNIGSKELSERYERDGYTIQMVGVVADEHTSFLLYDLILDEEYVFNCEDMEFTYQDGDNVWVYISEDGFPPNSYLLVENFLSEHKTPEGAWDIEAYDHTQYDAADTYMMLGKDGNVFHCVMRYDIHPLWVSIKDEELTFNINSLRLDKPKNENIQYYSTEDSADTLKIKYDFVNDCEERVIEDIDEHFTFDGEAYSIEEVYLTPFTLGMRILWDKEASDDNVEALLDNCKKLRQDVQVKFKNGAVSNNELLFEQSGDRRNASNRHGRLSTDIQLLWKYPVNLSDIKSISIGDCEFKIN